MNKNSRRVLDRVQDIRESLANIKSDIGTLTKEQFLVDGKTQRAVIEGIIVVGEAANRVMHLDPALEQRNPDVWQHFRDAYDMRIVLTHEYFRVDVAVVWDTVISDLPKLQSLLDTITVDDHDGDGDRPNGPVEKRTKE